MPPPPPLLFQRLVYLVYRQAFKAVDTDGSGRLDASEMAQLLGMDASEVKDVMVECDKDGDGHISFDEFWAAMQSMPNITPVTPIPYA